MDYQGYINAASWPIYACLGSKIYLNAILMKRSESQHYWTNKERSDNKWAALLDHHIVMSCKTKTSFSVTGKLKLSWDKMIQRESTVYAKRMRSAGKQELTAANKLNFQRAWLSAWLCSVSILLETHTERTAASVWEMSTDPPRPLPARQASVKQSMLFKQLPSCLSSQ